MKTIVHQLKQFTAIALSLLFVSTALLADGEISEIYLSGNTNTAAGSFVVTGTDDVYHFMGEEYIVYNVYYDNPSHNMKIAVLDNENCNSFIAYTGSYWFRYNCTKEGFGVRKVMFSSPAVMDNFDAQEFHDQTILVRNRKIEKEQAIGLIAAYLPKLQG